MLRYVRYVLTYDAMLCMLCSVLVSDSMYVMKCYVYFAMTCYRYIL